MHDAESELIVNNDKERTHSEVELLGALGVSDDVKGEVVAAVGDVTVVLYHQQSWLGHADCQVQVNLIAVHVSHDNSVNFFVSV